MYIHADQQDICSYEQTSSALKTYCNNNTNNQQMAPAVPGIRMREVTVYSHNSRVEKREKTNEIKRKDLCDCKILDNDLNRSPLVHPYRRLVSIISNSSKNTNF